MYFLKNIKEITLKVSLLSFAGLEQGNNGEIKEIKETQKPTERTPDDNKKIAGMLESQAKNYASGIAEIEKSLTPPEPTEEDLKELEAAKAKKGYYEQEAKKFAGTQSEQPTQENLEGTSKPETTTEQKEQQENIFIGSFEVDENGKTTLIGIPKDGYQAGKEIKMDLESLPTDKVKALPTYGQHLPENVFLVEVDGKTYERRGLNGEFAEIDKDGKATGNFLEMDIGQTLKIKEVRTETQIKETKEKAEKDLVGLIKENPALKENEAAVKAAFEKGYTQEDLREENLLDFIIKLFLGGGNDLLSGTSIGYESDGQGGYGKTHFGKAKEYIGNTNVKPGKIERFKPLKTSFPYEHSGTSTLCSRTARKNLEAMGCKGVPSGNAMDVFNNLGRPKNPFPPNSENSSVKAVDLFVSSKSKYGHRACAVRSENGEWYVLDPYRSGGKSTRLIPAAEYMTKNQIIGAFYYSTES